MKKIFVLVLLVMVVCTNFILPCEKVNAEAQVVYWICGECGMKAKTLKGWIPKREVYDKNRYAIIIHFHHWEEVSYRTWLEF